MIRRFDIRRAVSILVVAIVLGSIDTDARAGTAVLVGVNVPDQQRISVDRIDHAIWDALLKKYVDDQGLVDYTAWKANSADMQALDGYLSQLSAASFAGPVNQNASLSFWINAYNAVTVKGILREYPTTSIRNHTARVFGYNIWKDLKLVVGEQQYSLEQIEHEVLRKTGEPRIHFAIVCASIGCPRLLNEAYVPAKLDEQLTSGAESFFANPRNFVYDPTHRTMGLSSILDWFGKDFGPNETDLLRRIAPYLPDAPSRQLAEGGSVRITYLDYNWDLNDQARRKNAAAR